MTKCWIRVNSLWHPTGPNSERSTLLSGTAVMGTTVRIFLQI